ncbi:MAG: ribonuclease III [Clostridia bacterium]|nr:ribonuclease III [Clostridia bacterium]
MLFYAHECEEIIGYSFSDKVLLRTCFTHTSYANEHGAESNEKLEYLGDSILNFVVADFLYRNVSGNEGSLTKKRAELVSATPLGYTVKNMGLDKFLLVGAGEADKPVKLNMCADLFEAVVAGIYLDGGFDKAKKFICDKLLAPLVKEGKKYSPADGKSRLQEYVQSIKAGKIEYVLIKKEGPDHSPSFTCGVKLNGKLIASDVGPSKKQAEQKAASVAMKKLLNQRGKLN